MSNKLTREQLFELRKVASQTPEQRREASALFWLTTLFSQASLVFTSLVFGFAIALGVDAKYGNREEDENNWIKALALAIVLSVALFTLLSRHFRASSSQPLESAPAQISPPSESGGSTLTPKQLRLLGRTGQALPSQQVERILTPAKTLAGSTPAPAPPSSSLASSVTPARPSVSAVAVTSSPLRLAQDQAKYSSPQSPKVIQPPRNVASAASVTQHHHLPSFSSPNTPNALVAVPASSKMTSDAVMTPTRLAFAQPKPISDEPAAFALVEELEKQTPGFLMEEAVSNLKRALVKYITSNVLEKLDDVHGKLASIKPAGSSAWYPMEVLEWEELRDVQEMHAYQVEMLSLPDRQELRRLIRQRKLLERYFEVKRRGNMVPFPRNYVLRRLRSLCAADLTNYNWSGGETFQTTAWDSTSFPTDAEILFRILCVWFDKSLKREVVGSFDELVEEDSFSELHVREEVEEDMGPAAAAAATTRGGEQGMGEWWGFISCGRQQQIVGSRDSMATTTMAAYAAASSPSSSSATRTFHPHWKVRVGGKTWEVCYGRSNLFHAVVLFLYSLRMNKVMGRVQELVAEVLGK